MRMKSRLATCAVVFALCVPSMLLAVDKIFDGGPTGTGTDWNVAENWDSDGVPGMDDNAIIGELFTSPADVEINGPLAGPISELFVGKGGEGVGTLTQTTGTLETRDFGWAFVGQGGDVGLSNTGTYNLSGDASFLMDVGERGVIDSFDSFFGPSEFHLGQSDTMDGAPVVVGNQGTLNISENATFETARMYLGNNQANVGTVNQSGGSVYVDDWLSIGRQQAATGTYNMSGGSLTIANDWLAIAEVGDANGTVEISGNAVVEVGVRDDGGPTGGIGVGRFGARTDRPETPEVEETLAGVTAQMSILGSNASISTAVLTVGFDGSNNGRFDGFFVKNDIDATLEFVADAGGVSPINVVGEPTGNPDDPMETASVWLNDGVDDPAFCADPVFGVDTCGNATLLVDLTAYTSTADVTLIDVVPGRKRQRYLYRPG